ncbi:SNARE associated golgi protein [Ditylenchus destructor]|nr:SNARE associated golgi protein [Ditylenchus destructor]
MGRKKSKAKTNHVLPNNSAGSNGHVSGDRRVHFNPSMSNGVHANGKTQLVQKGMHRSPSTSTLNRMEREEYVLWYRPISTLGYCLMESVHLAKEFLLSLLHIQRLILLIATVTAIAYFYCVPGQHQVIAQRFEKPILWSLYWVWLGVLSSIGLGTGLHTFVLYLGPHIAKITLAAFECNSVNFPEPPYPLDVTCPTEAVPTGSSISLWDIVSKVRLESLMWGVGTAFGELPPYFMARAARISGQEIDDEEYREYRAYVDGINPTNEMGVFARLKIKVEKFMEEVIKRIGFPAILLSASVPNPLFDLAGITCGYALVPFWTFFGATVIGKAIIKMHIQMLFVVLAFSENHVEAIVNQIKWIPHVGKYIQAPLKEFLRAQKVRLHRKPDDPLPEQASSMLGMAMNGIVMSMVFVFLVSLINSLAQRYHKRCCEHKKQKAQ